MGGDEDGFWAGFQGDLQEVPAVQPQDGPPIGVDVADGLQPPGEGVRRLQAGKEDQVVHLAGAAVFLVDVADLPGDDKPGRGCFPSYGERQAESLF